MRECTMCGITKEDAAFPRPFRKSPRRVCALCATFLVVIRRDYAGDTNHRLLAKEASKMRYQYQQQHLGGW